MSRQALRVPLEHGLEVHGEQYSKAHSEPMRRHCQATDGLKVPSCQVRPADLISFANGLLWFLESKRPRRLGSRATWLQGVGARASARFPSRGFETCPKASRLRVPSTQRAAGGPKSARRLGLLSASTTWCHGSHSPEATGNQSAWGPCCPGSPWTLATWFQAIKLPGCRVAQVAS
jgi:hypothetical protein